MSYNQTDPNPFQQPFYNNGLVPSQQMLSSDNNTPRSSPYDDQSKPLKRKRKAKSRKGLDKVFVCDVDGCDKKFTRSEHLARHKLNHSPKQVFHCTWPGCDKSFVREDLRARHLERHSKRQEVESTVKPIIQVQMEVQEYSPKKEIYGAENTTDNSPLLLSPQYNQFSRPSFRSVDGIGSTEVVSGQLPPRRSSMPNQHLLPGPFQNHQQQQQPPIVNQSLHPVPIKNEQLSQLSPGSLQHAPPVQSPVRRMDPTLRQASRSPLPSLPGIQQLVSERWQGDATSSNSAQSPLPPPPPPPTRPSLPPSVTSTSSSSTSILNLPDTSSAINSPNGMEINSLLTPNSIPKTLNKLHSTSSSSYFIQSPDSSTYLKPPHLSPTSSSTSVFTALSYGMVPGFVPGAIPGTIPGTTSTTSPAIPPTTSRFTSGPAPDSVLSPTSAELIDWYFSDSMFLGSRDFFSSSNAHAMYEFPLVDFSQLSTPPSFYQAQFISESKREQFLTLIPGLASIEEFTVENINHYFELYWRNFHVQFPILHKVSFEAEHASPHLLLSMILIGASYDGARDLAMAIGEPLRWILFSTPGFHPPTELPILQSLLLLEVYEKLMSTRKLHERAHIHHGATLQLIRRGSTLLNPGYAVTALKGADVDSTWRKWVEAESIKRAVFMAFMLDVLHSVLFGHGLFMGAHEMKLSLPCDDDRIWNSSNDERAKLIANPPILFLDALKKILNGQPVGLTGFASAAVRVGLLSIAIQMSQQAQHISSIGWGSFRDSWKSILVRSFNFIHQDFHATLAIHDQETEALRQRSETRSIISGSGRDDESVISRIHDPNGYEYANCHSIMEVNYHLIHIFVRVARYDLRVFCGDRRIMGRASHKDDFYRAKEYIYNWSKTPASAEAALHAIRALYCIYITGDKPIDQRPPTSPDSSSSTAGYNVTEDIFVHRPVMIVHCIMVFWAYAFCLEGPESSLMSGNSFNSSLKDHEWAMAAESGRSFLERMNQAHNSDELERIKHKNRTVGLLKWIILSLRESKWFALEEMCDILDDCVERSLGRAEYIELSEDEVVPPAVGY